MARLIIVLGFDGPSPRAKASAIYVGESNQEANSAMERSEADHFEIFLNQRGIRKNNPHPARREAAKVAARNALASARDLALAARQAADDAKALAHSLRAAANGSAQAASETPGDQELADKAARESADADKAEADAAAAESAAAAAAEELAAAEAAVAALPKPTKSGRR